MVWTVICPNCDFFFFLEVRNQTNSLTGSSCYTRNNYNKYLFYDLYDELYSCKISISICGEAELC